MRLLRKSKKLARILSCSSYRKALWKGVAAAVEHDTVLRGLSCNTIVDVGANRGQFALVARHCLPHATIFSFEPLAEAARTFQRVLGNETLVNLRQHAIGPNSFSCDMHVSQKDDSSSLFPIGPLHTRIFPGTEECRKEEVSVKRLDSVLSCGDIQPPAMLKADVEGYELEVLAGCGGLLDAFSYLYLEVSFIELNKGQPLAETVIEYARNRGFTLNSVFNVTYDNDGRSVQADFLFAKNNQVGTCSCSKS